MKKFLALLLVSLCFTAQARTIATAGNKSDGLFVLTDIPCADKAKRVAYSTSPKASTLFGCWFMDDTFIFIRWDDGDVRSYPIGVWTVVPAKKGDTL